MAYYDVGDYACDALGIGVSASKGGTKYIGIEVEPVMIARDGEWHEIGKKPQTRLVRLWLTEKTRERTISILREHFNFTGTSLTQLAIPETGVRLVLSCEHEESSNGKTYDKFDFPFVGGGMEFKSLPKDEIRALDNELADLLRPAYKQAPPPAKPPSRQMPPQHKAAMDAQEPVDSDAQPSGGDDVPF